VADFSLARGGGRGHTICSLRCSARVGVGEGAGARGLQSGVLAMCSSACVGVGEVAVACRTTARRRGSVILGACRRGRRRGCLQLNQLQAAWGATRQLSGIWLGLWVSASGGAAQSASLFARIKKGLLLACDLAFAHLI